MGQTIKETLTSKITLRAIVTLSSFIVIFLIIALIFSKAKIEVTVKGEIDATVFVSFLLGSLATVILEYLFRTGRQ